ncbi:hypothetical protein NAP1_13513 [Erythrobacter sp. NAP1]|uniref:hypothetical protein n=1 Tax=Erythrobacter sp. NAP1 TaxID=237727 RepID=UPI00006876BD|nr:hypothetical protein [Erythrobacter sp. NAP1]EAQ28620.1 hypothetical protein NAP1_13513 [Erythrobacter sp. NAP1]
MGALLGIPEWLASTIFVAAALSAWMGYGYWRIRRAHERLARMRPNPNQSEFLRLMSDECSPAAVQFVWDMALSYVEPRLTPHPDDDLVTDLMIDGDDIALDWPHDWARLSGVDVSDMPAWPEQQPATVRNYARWLDLSIKP